jgi:sporulation protein YlmC with PRC-barrel domain
MDIAIDAAVVCTDGRAGSVRTVVVDPVDEALTHLVVESDRWPHEQRLVSATWVTSSTRQRVKLGCSLDEVATLPLFEEHRFLRASAAAVPYATAWAWPFVLPAGQDRLVPVVEEHLPRGEVGVHRGARVVAADGQDVGRIEAFVVAPADGGITHLWVRTGHLGRRHEVAVPVDAIRHLGADDVELRLSSHDVEALPVFAVGPAPPATEDRDAAPESGELDADARRLANQAEPMLRAQGFTVEQIRRWAEVYVATEGPGDIDELLAWLDDRRHHGTGQRPVE